jgi:GT2 family glycosyltransferase
MESKCRPKSVYVLIPAYNRREITLRCLNNLKNQEVLNEYCVVVIDDGSTDGTSEVIENQFPEVLLIKGNGKLWWTGAISAGMELAHKMKAEYFIWMNDDTFPTPGTLQLMVEKCSQNVDLITCAQCYSESEFQHPTYGGHKKKFMKVLLFHTPLEELSLCDCMSGNLVCFPISVVNKIGLPPSKKLPHNMADVVYTWTAKKAGFKLIVCGNATAICELNPLEEGYNFSSIPMYLRWKLLASYKSNLYPPAFWFYCKSFYGYLAPIVFIRAYLHFILITLLRWIFPLSIIIKLSILKRRIFGENSSEKILREALASQDTNLE